MTTSTNQPAVQLYTCNGQDGSTPRKASHRHGNEIAQGYGQHDCVVIEQQGRIGGINNPEWGENQVGPVLLLWSARARWMRRDARGPVN